MEGQKCHQLHGCKPRILSAKLLKHTADWLCWWRKGDERYMAFLTPSFHSVNCFKVYLILIIYIYWLLKTISFKPVVAVYDQIFEGMSLGLANCKKRLSKLPNYKSQMSSNTIWKDNHIFFFSCAVASISYCQEASFGTETGHVGSQWLISSHCTLSAFSLNYLRQTSWLAATQTSDGLSLRRPEFGSH